MELNQHNTAIIDTYRPSVCSSFVERFAALCCISAILLSNSGTKEDPYIISGFDITAPESVIILKLEK